MTKIISDFDGVLTDLAHEALRVREIFYQLLGVSAQADWREQLERAVLAEPARWGWEVEGRITAYSDEDGFIFNNALAMALDVAVAQPGILGNLAMRAVKAQIQKQGHETFKSVAVAAYNQMVDEVKASADSPLEKDSPDVLRAMGARGFSVTIVSNSGTSRIEDILAKAGLGIPPFLSIRGGAQKFSLGEKPEWVDFGGRRVDVNRPKYREILAAERPLCVIGDVFSLDLALPFAMATRGEFGNQPLVLVLRDRNYTPTWIKSWVNEWKHPKIRILVLSDLGKITSHFNDLMH